MVYMLLAPAVPRCHRSRQPEGVSHDCRNGTFFGEPLRSESAADQWDQQQHSS